MTLEESFARHDARFAAWRARRPGGRYADFLTEEVTAALRGGRAHTTLGPRLKDCDDWWAHGRPLFEELLAVAPVGEGARVIDYGCGSLRIGAHYIRRQAPGAYMGLDLAPVYLEWGRDLLGAALLAEKRPRLGLIAATMPEAAAFGAALVLSVLAAPQVHPEETDAYYGDLKAAAAAPGCRVVLTANVAAAPLRYAPAGRAWPMERFDAWMHPLTRVAARHRHDSEKEGGTVSSFHLVYRR